MSMLLLTIVGAGFIAFLLICAVYGCTLCAWRRKESDDETYQNYVNEAKERNYNIGDARENGVKEKSCSQILRNVFSLGRNDYDDGQSNIASEDSIEDVSNDSHANESNTTNCRSNGSISYESLQIEDDPNDDIVVDDKTSRTPCMRHHDLPHLNQRIWTVNHRGFYVNHDWNGNQRGLYVNLDMNHTIPNVHSSVPKVYHTAQYVNKAFRHVNNLAGNGYQRVQI